MLSLFSLKSVGEGEGEEKKPVVAAEFASYRLQMDFHYDIYDPFLSPSLFSFFIDGAVTASDKYKFYNKGWGLQAMLEVYICMYICHKLN